MWPQWLFQPWPQLWISPSGLIGSVSGQSPVLLFGHDLRPQAEQGVSLCLLLERFLTKTSHLPLSPHGSSRL